MIKPYTQTTYETCLAVSLLQAIGEVNRKNEIDCIHHSLEYSKADFVIGHLDFIKKRFKATFKRYVNNRFYHLHLKRKNIPSTLKSINLRFIDAFIDKQPLLIIDTYYLGNGVHYPHWVTLLRKDKKSYTLFDPWDGKEKTLTTKQLSKALLSLRSKLNFCRQLLVSAQPLSSTSP